jgi:hypothetical protein
VDILGTFCTLCAGLFSLLGSRVGSKNSRVKSSLRQLTFPFLLTSLDRPLNAEVCVGLKFNMHGASFVCLDVFLTFEDAVILLVREMWVSGKEHERKRMRRG